MTKPVPQPDVSARLLALLLILSGTTGLVDAVSVLGLGRVFTANMTGNIVFLGFALAGVPGFAWRLFVVALLSFGTGAAIAGRLSVSFTRSSRRRWLVTVAVAEGTLLALAAAMVLLGPPPSVDSFQVESLIALTGAAMGIRNATVRALKVPDMTTTVLTLTITGLFADSFLGTGVNGNWRRRLAALVAMLTGAVVGALLVRNFGLAFPLGLTATVVLLATLGLADEPPETASA